MKNGRPIHPIDCRCAKCTPPKSSGGLPSRLLAALARAASFMLCRGDHP